jgi:AcrR family transcriptional regulator
VVSDKGYARAADPRPARTRAAIYAAVADLTDRSAGDVSVNAVIRASGVSRSAFYSHFQNLDDLLVSMLSEAFRDIAAKRAASLRADPRSAAREAQERLVTFVSDRRAFLRASLDWRVSSRAHETVVQAYAEGVYADIEARGAAAPQRADVHDLATFIAGGAVTLLTQWIREDDDETPRDVIVDRLMSVMPEWLIGPG